MMDATENPRFQGFMKLVDKFRTLGVRTNADTPADAKVARDFGAEGIGLFRTEHMFYGGGSDQPLFLLRKMILSKTVDERKAALAELFPFVKNSIKATLEAMDGLPVTIRLLDPPLHEFVPQDANKQKELAASLGIKPSEVKKRGEALHESNPMMGHRGVRLGITYPEVTEMQVRAIFESAAELLKAGKSPKPEIMVPVTCDVRELDVTKVIADRIHAEVKQQFGVDIHYLYGTMIEIPRACLLADKMGKTAQFFSFGTNDLTQMSFGFSRDDIGGFLPDYLDDNILEADPFQTIDQSGVGQLIQMAVSKGRSVRSDLKIGIRGEQGGDPASVEFCFRSGLDLRKLQPVPGADRPTGRSPSCHQCQEVARRNTRSNKTGTGTSRHPVLARLSAFGSEPVPVLLEPLRKIPRKAGGNAVHPPSRCPPFPGASQTALSAATASTRIERW